MKKTWLIILLGLMITGAPHLLYAQEIVKSDVVEFIDGKSYYMHTVEQGQTLYSLSRTYNIPVDELIYENPDAKFSLSIGQVLKIPVTSREVAISEDLQEGEYPFIFHIVKPRETLYGISRIYKVDLAKLKAANPGWGKGLKAGQYVKVPTDRPESGKQKEVIVADTGGKIHTVIAGETLYSISRKYKVKIPDLKAANSGLVSNLSIGQKLIIPRKYKEPEEQEEQEEFYEHTVAPKETLYGIARKYRTSIDSLKAINPDLTKEIFPGEVIRIPTWVNPNNFITHRVEERTRLRKIASKYALSVSTMKDANPDIRNRVRAGELLRVPVGPPPDQQSEELVFVEEETADPEPIPAMSDSIRCYEDPPRKGTFKVALMIPLYAEEARNINVFRGGDAPDPGQFKSFNFIQFYEGFMLALEEVNTEGLDIRLHVYDVDEKVSKTIKVLQAAELRDMDLIIGPFFSRNFKLVSNFAEMFDIMIVNPLTRRTEVLNNKNVVKMKPSRDAQPAIIEKFVKKYYPEANIILVRNNKYQYTAAYEEIRSRLEKILPYGVKVSNQEIYRLIEDYSRADTNLAPGKLYNRFTVEDRMIMTEQLERDLYDSTFFTNGIAEVTYSSDSIHGITQSASIVRKNLVIVLSNNEIFVPEVLTSLNDLKDTFDISVIGMPEWELLDKLETDYLLDLDVHFFTDSYYDYDDPEVVAFIERFREKYKTQPGNFAFDAYDMASYLLGAVAEFGTECRDCLKFYRRNMLKSNFIIAPAYPAGYENLYWNFCRYRNYQIIKFPDNNFYSVRK